jgi:beta-lactam-binding protein with PASTA domain
MRRKVNKAKLQPKNWKTLGLHLLSILLFLAVSIWLVGVWMDYYTRHGEAVEVPDVTRMRIDRAIETLESDGFRYEIIDSVFREDAQRMDVVEQDPYPGSFVKKNRMIYLTVNALEKPRVSLPRLQHKPLNLARILLKNSGLQVGDIYYKKTLIGDGLVLAGLVRGDTVQAYSYVEKGSKIDLLVSIRPGVDDYMDSLGNFISPQTFEEEDAYDNDPIYED